MRLSMKSVSPHCNFQLSGSTVFTEESCILRLRQILARLFTQIHIEFAIVLEGLHEIFARKLDLYRLTEMADARKNLKITIITPTATPRYLVHKQCTTSKNKQNTSKHARDSNLKFQIQTRP
jgi:Lhr-like helicase